MDHREGEHGQSRDQTDDEAQACNELRATLATNLKAARQKLQLSQAAFARKAGVKQNTLCQLEKASQNASLPMLVRLAVAAGVPAPALLIPGAVDRASMPAWASRAQ